MYLRQSYEQTVCSAARLLHEDRTADGAGSQGVQRTPKQRRRHRQGHRERCWADQSGQHAAHQQGHRARAQWRPRAHLCSASACACHVGSARSCGSCTASTGCSVQSCCLKGRRARCLLSVWLALPAFLLFVRDKRANLPIQRHLCTRNSEVQCGPAARNCYQLRMVDPTCMHSIAV